MVELTEKGMGLPSTNITRLQQINDISDMPLTFGFSKDPNNLN